MRENQIFREEHQQNQPCVLAYFCGVNTPTLSCLKLPIVLQAACKCPKYLTIGLCKPGQSSSSSLGRGKTGQDRGHLSVTAKAGCRGWRKTGRGKGEEKGEKSSRANSNEQVLQSCFF